MRVERAASPSSPLSLSGSIRVKSANTPRFADSGYASCISRDDPDCVNTAAPGFRALEEMHVWLGAYSLCLNKDDTKK